MKSLLFFFLLSSSFVFADFEDEIYEHIKIVDTAVQEWKPLYKNTPFSKDEFNKRQSIIRRLHIAEAKIKMNLILEDMTRSDERVEIDGKPYALYEIVTEIKRMKDKFKTSIVKPGNITYSSWLRNHWQYVDPSV